VHFSGTLETAYRACLWSRLASRVLLPLGEFDAATDEALYAGVQSIDWSTHLASHATLAVDAHTTLSKLTHSQYLAQRVKDAVVDQFRQRDGERPSVDTDEPDVRINVRLRRDRATLSLDLSGSPLHRRGWRELQGEAPLKENLAAAMLLRAGWPQIYAEGGALLDPMCGSGTLLIDGAWMAADVAPGLHREYFGFLGWAQHDIALWKRLHEEATQRAEAGLRALRSCFFGSDSDPRMVQTAKRNAQEAGVAGFFTLDRHDALHVAPPPGVPRGLVITNPPYGERLGEREQMPPLYRGLGEMLRARFTGWRAAVLALSLIHI
jgi:23S rRNA (guanine2445-N2)-methyltransferase / 23S rRNA (guanine2069-N7)-methyltransferase